MTPKCVLDRPEKHDTTTSNRPKSKMPKGFFFRSFIYPEDGPSSGEDFHGLQPCTIGFLTYISNGYNKFDKT